MFQLRSLKKKQSLNENVAKSSCYVKLQLKSSNLKVAVIYRSLKLRVCAIHLNIKGFLKTQLTHFSFLQV